MADPKSADPIIETLRQTAELTLYLSAVTRNLLPLSADAAREHIHKKADELRSTLAQLPPKPGG